MYLYKFELNTWREPKITRTVVEVEEKPKTYIKAGYLSNTRILKSDVGILSGYSNSTLYLLEDDTEKATDIFVESLKNKIKAEKKRIQSSIESSNKRIAEYENGIEVLSSRSSQQSSSQTAPAPNGDMGFMTIPDGIDDGLPFN